MFKPINGWTKEKIISRIRSSFTGKAKERGAEMCSYRTKDGRRCAVGLFIDDAVYDTAMEERPAVEVLDSWDLHGSMPLSAIAMETWQRFHDKLRVKQGRERQKLAMIQWVKNNVA